MGSYILLLLSISDLLYCKPMGVFKNKQLPARLQNGTPTQEVAAARRKYLLRDLHKEVSQRQTRINTDFSNGFKVLSKYSNTVTFFGSARLTEGNAHYEHARSIAATLAQNGYTIVTGGGGGIMEAANRGAYEAGGNSIGFNIQLPKEQSLNHYISDSTPFRYFFSRKVLLAYSAQAYVYFPGGFGTLDELFEIMTLIQTHKMEKAPIILVGTAFWGPLDAYIKTVLRDEFKTIHSKDTDLYTITDDTEQILRVLRNYKRKQLKEIFSN